MNVSESAETLDRPTTHTSIDKTDQNTIVCTSRKTVIIMISKWCQTVLDNVHMVEF